MAPIKFQIVKVSPLSGQIEVNFYNEDVPGGFNYAIDVPFENGVLISGDKLIEHISWFAPKTLFERAAALKQVPDMAGINSMVGVEFDVIEPAPVTDQPVPTEQVEPLVA